MHYQVSRNGQTYGPYTLEDLQRYLASGNVLPTDLAKSDEMPDWVPVSQLLGTTQTAPPAGGGFTPPPYSGGGYAEPPYSPAISNNAALAASPYPDAPNLHWGLVLLFAILTCSVFMFVWNIVVAAWLRRVQPNATALYYYVGACVLFVLQILASGAHDAARTIQPGIHTHFPDHPLAGLLALATWVVRLIARYSQRASLEEHYNTVEPIGLRLNPVMTFFFGGLYFQYHLNRINALKQAARYGVPSPY
jgi:hypothetical protein